MDSAALVALTLDLGAHDREHGWYVQPIVEDGNRAGPSPGTLAGMIDTTADITGLHGWVAYRDAVPLLAVIGDRLHWRGKSSVIPRSPWSAMGSMLITLDAAKNSA